MTSFYTLGTIISALGVTGLMILPAHQAAKKVTIKQVRAEEDDEIHTLPDQEYEADH